MQRILLIGEDEVLLNTRIAIFRAAGFEVESRSVTHRPESLFVCLDRYFEPSNISAGGKGSFDAVVLCHSLDSARISAISAEARREIPNSKIIVLETPAGPSVPSSAYDASVTALLGPVALLHIVRSQLNGPDVSSRLA